MTVHKVLAMVLAGGGGTRLHPLTAERSKPAVPFGGRYRLVDFVLSNLVNSGIHAIYVLVQYKSQSLIEHVTRAWLLSPVIPGQFVTVVPPQMREGPEWFHGTADAVHQNVNLIRTHEPDLVAVLGADHVYRMDVRQMVSFHLERGADASVAAIPVPIGQASAFGIIAADREGRVEGFQEKPREPAPLPGDPGHAYASMGIYLFSTGVLLEALDEAKQRGENDFGRHILPRLTRGRRVLAYDFAGNQVPGVRAYEEPGYWRDVGTIDAYFAAHQDILGVEPRFNLFNPRWCIHSSTYQGPTARILDGSFENSSLGAGTLIRGARVRNSVIRREVILEKDVEVDECIIMDYSVLRRGAKLRRTIVDRYNNIAPGSRIGFDPEADRARYHVTGSGIVVVPKGPHIEDLSRYH
jgi:glucose-1-phosphate adenylyltransferase